MKKRTQTILSSILFLPTQLWILFRWYPTFLVYSKGLSNLDSRFFYTEVDVHELFDLLGKVGTRYYKYGVIADFIYLTILAIFTYSILSWISESFKREVYNYINLTIVFIYAAADILENISIIEYINNTLSGEEIVLSRLALVTPVKHIMLYITIIYLVVLVMIKLLKRIKKAA